MSVARLLLSVIVLLLMSGAGFSAQMENLYSATVAVSSQSDSERNQGFSEALDRVVVKVTGNASFSADRALVNAFSNTDRFVQTFSFRENPEYQLYLQRQEEIEAAEEAASTNQDDQTGEADLAGEADLEANPQLDPASEMLEQEAPLPYLLHVSFAESLINSALSELNIPIWGKTRPSVLMWLVVEREGERRLVSAADAEAQEVMQAADSFGLPVFFPVADLADLSAVDTDELWGLFPGAVSDAAERYDPDTNAMMRIYELEPGMWSANWLVEIQQGYLSGEQYAAPLDQIWTQFNAELAEVLAAKYAVVDSSGPESSHLYLEVDSVNSFEDYYTLQQHLESLPPVKDVGMRWVEGDKIGLEVSLRTGRDQFFQHLELGGRLQQIGAKVIEATVQLNLFRSVSETQSEFEPSQLPQPPEPPMPPEAELTESPGNELLQQKAALTNPWGWSSPLPLEVEVFIWRDR